MRHVSLTERGRAAIEAGPAPPRRAAGRAGGQARAAARRGRPPPARRRRRRARRRRRRARAPRAPSALARVTREPRFAAARAARLGCASTPPDPGGTPCIAVCSRAPRPATAAALVLAAPAGAATFGSPGLGDPFFPLAGNGGYDVGHYALTLDYTARRATGLEGSALISATATQALDRFDLDLRGFDDLAPGGQRHARDVHARRPGAADHAARPARRRQRLHRPRRLRGHAVRRDRPRRLDRGLDPDRRRRVRRQRAAGHAGAGSRSTTTRATRRPTTSRSRSRRDHRAGQRRAALVGDQRRQDDVALARGLADGALPRDGDQRQVRPHRRPARTGCRSTTRSTAG